MKPLRVAPWVITQDLQLSPRPFDPQSAANRRGIRPDHCSLGVENPLIFRQRENGWRVYAFQSGPYLLFYRELPSMWIVAGLFHAMRSPDWLHDELAKLASRLK